MLNQRAAKARYPHKIGEDHMMTKPKTKTRKPAAKSGTPKSEAERDKFQQAHREMWNAINVMKMIELAASESIDGDEDNAEDYAHAWHSDASYR
jgi:hypothetical protein